MKKAIITGVTGQDGAYLTQLLLDKNYKVYGAFRRSSSVNFWRLEELGVVDHPNLELVEFDLTDQGAAIRLLQRTNVDEVYNLAAQSFVGVSFDQPATTAAITGIGVVHLLEAIRTVNPKIKFYQASTSEMFGKVQQVPQNEETDFYPRSPYGIAKLYAHWMTINYQESYNMFCCSGILFNHESPLRGKEFVTRKITDGVARISAGKLDCLQLGNLDARRDWGYAKDYVEGMWSMLQSEKPDNYVLATNRTETVRSFVEMSFSVVDIGLNWIGEGDQEKGICTKTGNVIVAVSPAYYRPAEVELLIGDASKALNALNWSSNTSLEKLCEMMVKADVRRIEEGKSF
jgi:GDPmannose 4,6-dehydratase